MLRNYFKAIAFFLGLDLEEFFLIFITFCLIMAFVETFIFYKKKENKNEQEKK